jgi:polyphosphate kinase 2 (PPK2 family)
MKFAGIEKVENNDAFDRLEQINNFRKTIIQNGTIVLKFTFT